MARIRSRRLYWDLPADTDVVATDVYAGDPADASFLANADAGLSTPLEAVDAPAAEWFINGLAEGTYQFCVVSRDGAGNTGDPYQHPAWVSVPLDLTAPAPCSGGGLEII